jgi:1A family penicillin-binding protein
VAQSAQRPFHPLVHRFAAGVHRLASDTQRLAAEIQRHFVRHRRLVLWVVSIFVMAVAAGVWVVARSLPGLDALQTLGDMSQATTLYDAYDRPVFTIFKEYRVEVPLSKVSPHLRRAILAIEDQRFAEHGGVDLFRIAGAAWADLRQRRAAQGGSTITQQLARQMFLDRKKTLARKIKEAMLAMRIEHMYSKDAILELYLNKVYFGDGLHGAEAAARGYFGKSASDLSLSEAALLAGLVSSPSNNAPTVSLPRAIARRNVVLKAMYDQGVITPEAFERAMKEKVELRDTLRREEPLGQYFKEEVRQELVKQFGWQRVSESGMRVYTTIDPEMQQAAERTIAQSLQQIEARRAARARPQHAASPDEPLQAALVAIDPSSGEVRAMVGGRDFSDSRFNRAIQARRQPGSAFKPFVYATALEAGYSPASVIDNLDEPVDTLEGAWMPEDEHSTAPAMTMRAALRTSSNRAAVRMLQNVGIAKTVDYAKRLGIGTLPSVPSLALGSGEVTLMSMTSAYSVFASGGVRRPPILIRRVEDEQGRTLFEAKPSAQQVVSPTTAFLMSSMLADVVSRGTAYRARQEGFTLPAAGKTGTTNDFVDAWFVGFTPKLVTGVWLGFDQPHTILANGFAGDLAVPLWARFMKSATAKDKPVWFTPPPGIVTASVCGESGLLAADGCDNAVTEYFARGTEPTETYMPVRPPEPEAQGVVAIGESREGPRPEATLQSARTIEAAEVPPAAPEADNSGDRDAPKKKHGFWGRLFGRH